MLPDGRKRGGLGLRKALAPVNRSSLAGAASVGATKVLVLEAWILPREDVLGQSPSTVLPAMSL